MAFYIGQEIVCIRDDWRCDNENAPFFSYAKKDSIYHVRGFTFSWTKEFIWLDEIVNPSSHYQGGICEPGFLASGFRPIIKGRAHKLEPAKLVDA